MLTSIYYYDFYKPYMMKTVQNTEDKKVIPAKPKLTAGPKVKNPTFLLNKKYIKSVIKYANQMSDSVNGVKESARFLLRDNEEFSRLIRHKGFQSTREWIKNDLQFFVDSYNETRDFNEGKKHSITFLQFADALDSRLQGYRKRLSRWGITKNDDGRLAFNADTFDNLNIRDMKKAMITTELFFFETYKDTTLLLRKPLSAHMNFRDLKYYFNYKIGGFGIETESFKEIESGMIVDKAV